jgi:hypothetical protein
MKARCRVVRTIEWRVVPDRLSRFTGHFSVSVAKRREWDYIVRVAGKGLARNPLIALRRLIAFRPFGRMCRSSLGENSTHSTRQNLFLRQDRQSTGSGIYTARLRGVG